MVHGQIYSTSQDKENGIRFIFIISMLIFTILGLYHTQLKLKPIK